MWWKTSNSDQYLWNKNIVQTVFNLAAGELQISDAPGASSAGLGR